jgi:multicomponent Na+:H+ antiporter subunit B
MRPSTRRLVVFAPAAAALTAAVVWGLAGLPDFGQVHGGYAGWILGHAARQRHVSNIVAAVVFDYRGWDTLGEESILFAAVMGTALLLRSTREVEEQRPHDLATSALVRSGGRVAIPLTLLFGLWMITYGYITPGGGFQGGVIAAGAALLIWVTGSYRYHRRATPTTLLDATEGLALFGYIAIGIAGMVTTAYLFDLMPLGTAGTLTSTGTIALLNWATGLEVAAATVLIFHEFLEEYIQTFPGAKADRE